jgi:ATP-dependent protease ClpP protease subunit
MEIQQGRAQCVSNDITTIGLGFCASMAQFLLIAGTLGNGSFRRTPG